MDALGQDRAFSTRTSDSRSEACGMARFAA
jgi:hypothetical protein